MYGDPILPFTTLGTLLVLVGFLGAFWSLGGASCLALGINRIRTARSRIPTPSGSNEALQVSSLEILIPAHNEEASIAGTLASLERGASVLLGLDHLC